MAIVAILQPYVPRYRVPLFDRLRRALVDDGHELRLVTGGPNRLQAARGDSASLQPGERRVRSRHVRLGPITASWKRAIPEIEGADLVVTQLGTGILESHQLLASNRWRVTTWGHGYATTGRSGWLDATVEGWQMRRSVHVFVYSERGACAATSAGVNPDRVTVLYNTTDTEALTTARNRLRPDDGSRFRASWDLGQGPVVASIGALDDSKRIDLLLRTADALAERIPGFKLVMAGDGPRRADVLRAAANPHVVHVGIADDRTKARMAAVSSVLLNPGRVGLVATDSFALELPIVTTHWAHHAPEFEYLHHGVNAVVTADHPEAYADAVAALLADPDRREHLRAGCRESSAQISLDAMVRRFCCGIATALAGSR